MQERLILTVFLLLSGCDSIKGAFGMNHYQADEFNIVEHAPLSLPPNYNLCPPRTKVEGKSIPVNIESEQAQAVIGKSEYTKISAAANKSLTKDNRADDSIRYKLEAEEDNNHSGISKKISGWEKEFKKNLNSMN